MCQRPRKASVHARGTCIQLLLCKRVISVITAHLPESVQQSKDELVFPLQILAESLGGGTREDMTIQLLVFRCKGR